MYTALHKAKIKFYEYQQSNNELLADHLHSFKDLCSTVEYHIGDIFYSNDMAKRKMREDLQKKANQHRLGILLRRRNR